MRNFSLFLCQKMQFEQLKNTVSPKMNIIYKNMSNFKDYIYIYIYIQNQSDELE